MPTQQSVVSDANIGKLYEFTFDNNYYDQRTYIGRFMHSFRLVNPLNFFKTQEQLNQAKNIV